MAPLDTDSDILLTHMDDSNARLNYSVYDEVADEWSVVDRFGDVDGNTNTFPQNAQMVSKKATGDVLFVMMLEDNIGAITCTFFSDSTRTWLGIDPVTLGSTENSPAVGQFETYGLSLAWFEPTKTWILQHGKGGTQLTYPMFTFSNDDGKSWSDLAYPRFHNFATDDIKSLQQPLVYINAEEGFSPLWFNDDLDDIVTMDTRIHFKAITGVVKDDAGATVSGAEVKVFRSGYDPTTTNHETYMGTCITDGSGNYSCGVVARNGIGGADVYYTVATDGVNRGPMVSEDFNSYRQPLLDLALYTSTGTAVTHNITNKELDFDASTTAADIFNITLGTVTSGTSTHGFSQGLYAFRFKIRFDTVTQGASATRSGFYVLVRDNSIILKHLKV